MVGATDSRSSGLGLRPSREHCVRALVFLDKTLHSHVHSAPLHLGA